MRRPWLSRFFSVYQPAWHGGFLWDDDSHLLNNPVLRPGALAEVWVPGTYINYWPITFAAYWFQYKLWGLQPLGYHLVNLALHAISSLLVWRLLVRLRVPGAMFAAAIFALHPVNVESVAWIAQLKGVLSLLLTLVSVLLYVGHERYGGRWRYAAAVAAFLLSGLAKGAAVTLPIVLLSLAWWRRGRIAWRDLLRVMPFMLIGAAVAGVEIWSQHLVARGGGTVRRPPLPDRRRRLRRVVLPGKAALAARPLFRLPAVGDRQRKRAIVYARRCVGGPPRFGVVAAA